MSFYGQDPYGYGIYGQPGYYPPYPAQYYPPNTHQRRKPRAPKDNAQMWCAICGVGCIGQQSYTEHCNGKKHQLIARKVQPMANSSDNAAPNAAPSASSSVRYTPYDGGSSPPLTNQDSKTSQGKFYCEICHVYSTDQNTFNLHLTGKKHKTIVQRSTLQTPPQGSASQSQPTDDPSPPPSDPPSFITLPRYNIPSAPKGNFKPLLINHPSNLADDHLLSSRLATLSPTAENIAPLSQLVQTIFTKLGEYKVSQPEGADEPMDPRFSIMDMALVGPYARGTLIKGFLCADIVVITKDPPDLNMLNTFQSVLHSVLPNAKIESNADKFDLYVRMPDDISAHLMLTWSGALDAEMDGGNFGQQLQQQEATGGSSSPTSDDTVGVNVPACQKALMMVRQMYFFSDNALSPNLRPCLKILKDLRNRMPVFSHLDNWAIEVVIINALRTVPLSASLSQSLRAIFAFMASGMLLPGVEFIDPCAQEAESVLRNISDQARLDITEASQKILNDMAFGKWEEILGF